MATPPPRPFEHTFFLLRKKPIFIRQIPTYPSFLYVLKGTLVLDFFILVFCNGRIILEFANIFKFFIIRQWFYLTRSLIPCQLSQCWVRLHVDWVIVERDHTSTEFSQKDKIFINVGAFHIDSGNIESHSALTQLKGSLVLCNSVCEDELSQSRHPLLSHTHLKEQNL